MSPIAVIPSFPTRTATNFSGTSGLGRSWGRVFAAKKVWSVDNFTKQFHPSVIQLMIAALKIILLVSFWN